jgi:hypothetical protein
MCRFGVGCSILPFVCACSQLHVSKELHLYPRKRDEDVFLYCRFWEFECRTQPERCRPLPWGDTCTGFDRSGFDRLRTFSVLVSKRKVPSTKAIELESRRELSGSILQSCYQPCGAIQVGGWKLTGTGGVGRRVSLKFIPHHVRWAWCVCAGQRRNESMKQVCVVLQEPIPQEITETKVKLNWTKCTPTGS